MICEFRACATLRRAGSSFGTKISNVSSNGRGKEDQRKINKQKGSCYHGATLYKERSRKLSKRYLQMQNVENMMIMVANTRDTLIVHPVLF